MALNPPGNGQKTEAAPPPGKNRWLLPVGLLVVGAAAIGGATWYFTGEAANAKPRAAEEKTSVFVPLEAFTVNLQEDGGDGHLQVAMTLKASDPTVEAAIRLHMPEIRNDLLILLSDKKSSELASKQGKEALVREITVAINRVIAPAAPVTQVLFTSFIIQ